MEEKARKRRLLTMVACAAITLLILLLAVGTMAVYLKLSKDRTDELEELWGSPPKFVYAPMLWRSGYYEEGLRSFPQDAEILRCTLFPVLEGRVDWEEHLGSGELLLVWMSEEGDWVGDIVVMQGKAEPGVDTASSVLTDGFYWGMPQGDIEDVFGEKLQWKVIGQEQRVAEGAFINKLEDIMHVVVVFITQDEKLAAIQQYHELTVPAASEYSKRHFTDVLSRELGGSS